MSGSATTCECMDNFILYPAQSSNSYARWPRVHHTEWSVWFLLEPESMTRSASLDSFFEQPPSSVSVEAPAVLETRKPTPGIGALYAMDEWLTVVVAHSNCYARTFRQGKVIWYVLLMGVSCNWRTTELKNKFLHVFLMNHNCSVMHC